MGILRAPAIAQRVKGEESPSGARILPIAHAYDSLTSERAYRSRFSYDQAV